MDPPTQKKTYKKTQVLEPFFTGGQSCVTRDGKYLACVCGDEVKVVDIATGAVLQTFQGDTEPITALAVSPDCTTLVAASRSLMLRVYDLQTGQVKRSWRVHKAAVADIAIDASGGYVATASADRTIRVWDLQAGFCTHSFVGHSGVVLRVMFHPKQLLLFSGGDDSEVRVWDLVEKQCTAALQAHFSAVTSLALSPDGWLLLSGGRDKVVVAWDLRNNSKVATIPVYEAVEGLVCCPLGSAFPNTERPPTLGGAKKMAFFATAGEKGRIKLWRTDTGTCVYECEPEGGSSAAAVAAAREYTDLCLLPAGAGLMATTGDARLLFYYCEQKPSTPTSAPSNHLSLQRQLVGNIDEVTDVRLVGGASPLAPSNIAVASNCEVVRLFDMGSLSCTTSLVGHKDIVLAMDAATWGRPDNSSGSWHTGWDQEGVVVSGGKDAEVRVWAVPSGRCLGVGVGHVGSVSAVALGRKGSPPKFIVSAGSDKLLKVWDLGDLLEAAAASCGPGGSKAAKRAKKAKGNDQQAVTVGAHTVASLRVSAAIAGHDKDINTVAVAPNDSLIATGSQDRTVKVWRLPSLVPVTTLKGHKRGVWCVEFSPVDQAVITASGDKTVKMWTLADGGSCVRTFEGHTATVLRASFATSGTQVLSAGADGLVKLWSLRTGECINTFDEHTGKIWAMTSGGKSEQLLVTGGADATVVVWHDSTAEDAAAAAAEEDQVFEREQALSNALADLDFASAARLAFDLKHPGRLLTVIQRTVGSVTVGGSAGQGPRHLLPGLVEHMSDEDLRTALEYCRSWNTNTRNCHAAHAMLKAILAHKRPAQLLNIPGVQDLVDALLVYTQRHFSRVDRLVRSAYMLDYTLAAMKVVTPQSMQQEEQEEVALQQQQQGHTSASQHQQQAGSKRNRVGATEQRGGQHAIGTGAQHSHSQQGALPNGTSLANGVGSSGSDSSKDEEPQQHKRGSASQQVGAQTPGGGESMSEDEFSGGASSSDDEEEHVQHGKGVGVQVQGSGLGGLGTEGNSNHEGGKGFVAVGSEGEEPGARDGGMASSSDSEEQPQKRTRTPASKMATPFGLGKKGNRGTSVQQASKSPQKASKQATPSKAKVVQTPKQAATPQQASAKTPKQQATTPQQAATERKAGSQSKQLGAVSTPVGQGVKYERQAKTTAGKAKKPKARQ